MQRIGLKRRNELAPITTKKSIGDRAHKSYKSDRSLARIEASTECKNETQRRQQSAKQQLKEQVEVDRQQSTLTTIQRLVLTSAETSSAKFGAAWCVRNKEEFVYHVAAKG